MRLIDADKMNLLLGISDRDIYAKRMLDHMDTVDAVPVVHCKDCKHYLIANEFDGGKRNMCEVNHFSYLNSDGDMHFCSHGERRDDA